MKKILLLTSVLPFSCLFGAISTDWVVDANGNWSGVPNWNNGVPNAQDDTALIGNVVLTASRTITQDIAPTVNLGSILFVSTAPGFGYTIVPSGTNTITFNVSTGSALINVIAPNVAPETISAPIALASNLNITQNSASNLTLSGVISGASSITSSGTGTVVLGAANNTFSGGLIISAGTVQCGTATTLPATGSVTLSGGILNLNNTAQTIGGITGTSNITLGTATLTINTTAANSYSGQITGTGGLTVGGTGSLNLSNTTNNYPLTTVTGGTLQLGATNALPVGQDVNLTAGTLDLNNFNQSVGNLYATGGSITLGTGQLSISLGASQNFAGVISGTGPVSFTGNGFIWTLGAAQTYTGLTTINNGTIQLGITNGLPSGGPVTLTSTGILNLNNFAQTTGTLTGAVGSQVTLGSGVLTVAPTAATNFAGVISGSGSLVYQGPSTWTFQTPQTYTGGTTINGGTLQMGVANALAPTGAVTINSPGVLFLNNNPLTIKSLSGNGTANLGSGALTLNTTGTTTFSGPIIGSGSLIVNGSGIQIVTGPNSYSGGTTVGGSATLQGNTSSLQGAIVNNSTLYFNQSFNGTYGGALSGAGQLLVGGGGTVTLTGASTQGTATVLSGELDVASGSTLTATTVTVNSGATIGGEGTFAANVLNAGRINPGSVTTLGTLTVNGNVTFQAGSTMIVNLTPTASDKLVVTGQVFIDPSASLNIDAIRGEYEEETRYAIITSSSFPVIGQFQSFTQTNPFLEVEMLYNQILPGSVEVDLQIRSLSDVIQGGNAGAIAKCITQTNMKFDHDLEQLVSEIIFFSVDKVRKILDEMQPSELRALTVAEQTNTLFAQQMLNWRMLQLDNSTCEKEVSKCFPINFWANLAGNWTDQRHADHNVGYTAPAIGLEIGFDGRVSDNSYLGLAAEYGFVGLDWNENQGSTEINRVSGGPYFSYVGKFGYVNVSALGSFAHFDTVRHITSFSRTASSKHFGENILSHLDGGFVLHPAPSVSLTPFAMLDYLYGWEDSYEETGAESLNFKISSSTSSMLRSEVGLKISKCAIHSHTKWVHDIKASWVREDRFHGKDLTATFRQFPCTFTVEGLYPTRNFLDVGMGLTFIFKQDKFAATLRYEGQFGEGVNIQSGIAQFLTRF